MERRTFTIILRPLASGYLSFAPIAAILQKKRLHVAVEEVLGDAAGNDGAVFVEGLDVGFAHHRGDLEADVEELTDVRIVERIALIVAERAGEFFARPFVHGFGAGEFREVDVDDGGVGLAEGFLFR